MLCMWICDELNELTQQLEAYRDIHACFWEHHANRLSQVRAGLDLDVFENKRSPTRVLHLSSSRAACYSDKGSQAC